MLSLNNGPMSVRWGIWGPGRQARAVAPDFKVADGAELVAVGSRSQERADAFASEFGLPQAYGSLDVLAASDVDAVFVTTPHGGHVPECVALANAGKHLIVEKSMATTPDGVREIADAVHPRFYRFLGSGGGGVAATPCTAGCGIYNRRRRWREPHLLGIGVSRLHFPRGRRVHGFEQSNE